MRAVRNQNPALKAIVLAAVFVGLIAFQAYLVKQVTIKVDGQRLVVKTWQPTVSALLQERNINLAQHDAVYPAPDSSLRDGAVVEIVRAFPVKIRVDGGEQVVYMRGGTVEDALAKADVALGPEDLVAPRLTEEVKNGDEIRIVRVRRERIVEYEEIDFGVRRWAEPKWEKGRVGVLREGREGLKQFIYEAVYEDGVMVDKKLVSEEVIRSPRDKIIGIGTRIIIRTQKTPAGTIRYRDVKRMVATAYYPGPESTGKWADGITATGMPARHGIVAVDPDVISLGTKLYIPGYGIALAADVGGAIKGNRIDLCFDTYREAIHFGRKVVDVYILE